VAVTPFGGHRASIFVRIRGREYEQKLNGTTSFTINDGYGSNITVMVNDVALPPGFDTAKTAVVTGVLSPDKAIQAQEIRAL